MTIHEYLGDKITDTFEVDVLEETDDEIIFETWRFPPRNLTHTYKIEGDERRLDYEELDYRDEGSKRIFTFRGMFF